VSGTSHQHSCAVQSGRGRGRQRGGNGISTCCTHVISRNEGKARRHRFPMHFWSSCPTLFFEQKKSFAAPPSPEGRGGHSAPFRMRVKDKRGISPLHLGMHEFARLAEERIMVQESSLRGESSHSPPTGASFRPPWTVRKHPLPLLPRTSSRLSRVGPGGEKDCSLSRVK